jgi:hypothetical protein
MENLMNKYFPILGTLVVIALFAATYGAIAVEGQPAAPAIPKAAEYEALLGKSLTDKVVTDFIALHRCSRDRQFQMCNDAGVVLWLGLGQEVEAVYLYPNQTRNFAAYKGELPLGLSANDTKASVEEKLGQPNVERVLKTGWVPGRPDEGARSDHFDYMAADQRFGLTIVYNAPSATYKDATIYAVLVSR